MQKADFIEWLFNELTYSPWHELSTSQKQELMRDAAQKLGEVIEHAIRGIVTESGELTMDDQ